MASKPKNIVVCLDGTGNQIEENLSNVLKLFRTLTKSENQVVFYDQGVGTLGRRYTWGRNFQGAKNLLGLAFGLGLDENVLKAYKFIVHHYEERKVGKSRELVRDKIFIFGFSRGAHTARVLAGLIYEVGLIDPDQVHLAGAALSGYKQSASNAEDGYEGEGANFKRVMGTTTGSIEFLGLWDTVSSVFTPQARGKWWPLIIREKLPHTSSNPAVLNFRHAIAIDEKRRMFRVDHWEPDQDFKPNKHVTGDLDKQCAKEVWFSGYHSDVGGGQTRVESGLSQIPLIWMIEEAVTSGLLVYKRMAEYVSGQKSWTKDTKYIYPEPKTDAPDHDSLASQWKFLEYVPKGTTRREWKERRSILGYYLPRGEPRPIPEGAILHNSVLERIAANQDYKPENIPIAYVVE